MSKEIVLLFALIYMIFMCWISLDCDEEKEHELKYITLGLAGLVPLIMCVIIA
jgi:hypothetical protein